MSIATDLKDYADAAVESGRAAINDGIASGRAVVNDGLTQLRTVIDGGLEDANARAAHFTGFGSGLATLAAARAKVNALAAVGVSDAVVSALLDRVQTVPGRVQTLPTTLAGRLQDRVTSAAGAVDGMRSGAALDQVRRTAESYGSLLGQGRDALAKRGEDVLDELRSDPRVRRAVGLADRAGDTVAEAAGDATTAVTDVAARPARRRAGEQAAATRARNTRRAATGTTSSRRAATGTPSTRRAATGTPSTRRATGGTTTRRARATADTAAATSRAAATTTAARATTARKATARKATSAAATGTRTAGTRGRRSSTAR